MHAILTPPTQDTRGAYSHPHKTHGVHTSSPTRHTGCMQAAPQDTRGAYKQPQKTHGVHTSSPMARYTHEFFKLSIGYLQVADMCASQANGPATSLLPRTQRPPTPSLLLRTQRPCNAETLRSHTQFRCFWKTCAKACAKMYVMFPLLQARGKASR